MRPRRGRICCRAEDRVAGHPNVGEVRGVGLMAAVEFMADPKARRSVRSADVDKRQDLGSA